MRQIGRAAFIVNVQLTFAPHFYPVYPHLIWVHQISFAPSLWIWKSFKLWSGGNCWITAFKSKIKLKNQVGKDGQIYR